MCWPRGGRNGSVVSRDFGGSGQIQMHKVDGWETLSQPLEPMSLDLAA
ncbi:hypothetical protein GH815_10085 [Rhodovulum strictum]|uniref:Uncharacterized protein n=1 Tax=Rhodovulum strictum TaxID=58314 RepID=A0A844BAB0_9RHOB|nr:hypothetical protein [Rhodovulum strictum]